MTPSKDPADESGLAGSFRSVFRKVLQSTDGMLPAEVISYDRESNTATVRPIIAVLTMDSQIVKRAQIAKVPVIALGAGGFVVNFPMQPGDMGWIEASDRDISLFMQSLSESPPNTQRMHSFEDGRFIPDVFRSYDVSGVAEDAMTIQSLNGTVRVELSPSKIRYVAPLHEFDGAVKLKDTLEVIGTSTLRDDVATTGALTNNGVNVGSTHTHSGVQSGGGTSGPPV